MMTESRGIQSLESHQSTPAHDPTHWVRLLDESLAKWPLERDPSRLIDVGCGRGEFILACELIGITSLGIEADFETSSQAFLNGASVLNADVSNNLPLKSGSVDVVFANQLIEHLNRQDGEELLAEALRVLRTPGLLVVNSPSFFNRWNRTKPFHIHCWKPLELKSAAARVGFSHVDILDRLGKQLSIFDLLGYDTRIPIGRYWERRPSPLVRFFDLSSRVATHLLYRIARSQNLLRVADIVAIK